MAVLSTGQITIVDYNDAVSLSAFVSSNQALTQIYNPDNETYIPSWASSNLVLTPSLFASVSGSTDVITSANIKSIKWFDGATEIVANTSYGLATFTAGQNRPLTVKANILAGSVTAKTFVCEIVYTDSVTASDLTVKASITVSRVNNGGGVTIAQVTTPTGNIFKNGSGANLTAKAELLRASGVDTSNVTYLWYKYSAGSWTALTSAFTGYNTNTLTIKPTDVDGVTMFKCIITDTDTASPTENQAFEGVVTFLDQTDPIQVVVVSSAGDVLKNGVGSTTLTAKLYQNAQEIDSAGSTYTYKWYKADKNGTADANFGGTGIAFKSGKTLTVGGADVDVKAIFTVEVS